MFVMQEWVSKIGLKMQSILMSDFRSPDHKTIAIKKCIRWLRSRCQINADPEKESYMQTISISVELIDAAIEELEYCTVHFTHHFADAFAVVAFYHPDQKTAAFCHYLYHQVAEEKFHFHPMTRLEFCQRHMDKI